MLWTSTASPGIPSLRQPQSELCKHSFGAKKRILRLFGSVSAIELLFNVSLRMALQRIFQCTVCIWLCHALYIMQWELIASVPSGVDDVILLSMKLNWADDKSGSTTQVDIWHPRVTWSTEEIGLASNVLHNGPQGPLGRGGGAMRQSLAAFRGLRGQHESTGCGESVD